MKIVIDAKKNKLNELINYRGCSKSNLRLTVMLSWLESYNTDKPVEFEYEWELVKIQN